MLTLADGTWTTTARLPPRSLRHADYRHRSRLFCKISEQKIKVSHNLLLAFKSTFCYRPHAQRLCSLCWACILIGNALGGVLNNLIKAGLSQPERPVPLWLHHRPVAATAIDLGPILSKQPVSWPGFHRRQGASHHSRVVAIVVPSSVGLATHRSWLVVNAMYLTSSSIPELKTAVFLALMGISEGAIPLPWKCPE